VVAVLLQAYKDASEVVDEHVDLPLHLASANGADVRIVKALLEVFPKGASTSGQGEHLPLHSALANKAGLDVVKALLQTYKHASEVCAHGRLPQTSTCGCFGKSRTHCGGRAAAGVHVCNTSD